MKRQGRLLEQIADLNNLYKAFYKAQKGKHSKPYVSAYREQLQQNLQRLQCQIISGAVEAGNYHTFTIYDPKKRLICATPFSQRVLHHALMNICHPSFENHQLAGSFASRTGKGTYAALLFRSSLLACFQLDCTELTILERGAAVCSKRSCWLPCPKALRLPVALQLKNKAFLYPRALFFPD